MILVFLSSTIIIHDSVPIKRMYCMQQIILYFCRYTNYTDISYGIKYSIMWRHMQDIVSVIVWYVPIIFIITIIIMYHIDILRSFNYHLYEPYSGLEILFRNEFLSSPRETCDSGFCLNGLPSTQLFMRIKLNVPMHFLIIYCYIAFGYLIMRCNLTKCLMSLCFILPCA